MRTINEISEKPLSEMSAMDILTSDSLETCTICGSEITPSTIPHMVGGCESTCIGCYDRWVSETNPIGFKEAINK